MEVKYNGLVILVSLLLVLQASAQISPGKLTQSHADLEGMSNCTKCHLLGEKVSNEKCLDCHQEISSRITEKKGYHSSSEVRGNDCIKCHSEHHGRNFQMIHFDPDKFDHEQAGYTLKGAHTRLVCGNCHKSEFIANPKIKLKSSTYLGLEQNCLFCHTDYHQATLSPDCSSCHDNEAFKPASKFDHNKTGFKLIGKHASVACSECHQRSVSKGIEMQKFAGVSYGNCTNCHRDVHENKFGQNCVQCHSEESFHQIRKLSNFNHSQTNYPLTGKHQYVACGSCHKSRYTDPVKHTQCNDCHSDYHYKQFARKGVSPDCSECHSIHGFEQTDFTIERHNMTGFELSGAHLATPCFDCHKKESKWSFREIGKECMDCHTNIHETYLDNKYYRETGCAGCHSNNSWSEVSFDHSKTNFNLEGAHFKQSCRSCHFRVDDFGILHQAFSQLSSNCTNCHQDAHRGQFDEAVGTNCLKCHDYADWSAGRFDHSQTAFELTGKHRDVACKECHMTEVTAQVSYTLYKLNNTSCESCH